MISTRSRGKDLSTLMPSRSVIELASQESTVASISCQNPGSHRTRSRTGLPLNPRMQRALSFWLAMRSLFWFSGNRRFGVEPGYSTVAVDGWEGA